MNNLFQELNNKKNIRDTEINIFNYSYQLLFILSGLMAKWDLLKNELRVLRLIC